MRSELFPAWFTGLKLSHEQKQANRSEIPFNGAAHFPYDRNFSFM